MNSLLISQQIPEVDPDIRVWGGDDAFTHTLIFGPTRCGKTSTILSPAVYELLKAKKRGKKVGFSVIEPKGDLVRDIYNMAVELGLEDEVVFLDPTDPNSQHLNVMQGEEADVIEATVAVLQSIFGKQEAFFTLVQETSTRNVVALLKRLYGDNLDLPTVLENLRDLDVMKVSLNAYKQKINGTDDLTKFFDNELLGTGKIAEDYKKLVIGLRSQLENIISNPNLRNVITGNSSIRIDQLLEEGKILLVNTAAGLLGKAGDVFGTFIAMHIQLATFRRGGTEFDRIPHYLIIDEYAQYINPYVARFLSFAASYRVALIAALQSFSQLEVAAGTQDARTVRNSIINLARNKIVFGGLENEDALYASKMMGSEDISSITYTYDGGLIPNFVPKSSKYEKKERMKFSQRFFMDGMPRFHCVCKLVENGVQTPSFLAKGEWIPQNWKELDKEEDRILRMPDEERLSLLIKNKPSIFKWKERSMFEVEIDRLNERIKKRELLGENPFKDMEQTTNAHVQQFSMNLPVGTATKPDDKQQDILTNNYYENVPSVENEDTRQISAPPQLTSTALFSTKARVLNPVPKQPQVHQEQSVKYVSEPKQEEIKELSNKDVSINQNIPQQKKEKIDDFFDF